MCQYKIVFLKPVHLFSLSERLFEKRDGLPHLLKTQHILTHNLFFVLLL